METVKADELIRQKRELQEQIEKKNEYLFNIGMGIQKNNRKIAEYEQDIERGNRNWELLIKLYYEAKEETIKEENVDDNTVKLLDKLKKDISEEEADIENAQAMILKLQECNKDNLANKEKLEKEVADMEKEAAGLEEQLSGFHDSDRKTESLTQAEDLSRQKIQLMDRIDEKRLCLRKIDADIQKDIQEMKKYTTAFERRETLCAQWKAVSTEEFDKAYPGHGELPSDERECLLSEFERSKAEKLSKIKEEISEAEADMEEVSRGHQQLWELNSRNIADRDKLKEEIDDLERQLFDINLEINHTGKKEEYSRYLIEQYHGFKRELIRNIQWDGPIVAFEVNGIKYCSWTSFDGAIPQLSINGYTAKHHNDRGVLVKDWYYEKYIKDKPARIIRFVLSDEDENEGEWVDTGIILENQEEAEKYIDNHNNPQTQDELMNYELLHYEIISDFSCTGEEAAQG